MNAALPLSWILPGTDDPGRHATCGEFATWGHGSPDGWHWRRGRRGCGAFECPADLATGDSRDYRWRNAYTTRQARRIVLRLGKRSQHGVVSPPGPSGGPCPPPESPVAYRKLRAKAYAILRSVGVTKAGIFPHPTRCVRADRRGGHEGFHFHFQTPCRIDPVKVVQMNRREGWVVKGLGFKPTLQVAVYELHHVGRLGARLAVLPNPAGKSNLEFATEAVTWFGEWSRALKVDRDGVECPVCHEVFPTNGPLKGWFELVWNGDGPPPTDLCGVGGSWRFPWRAGRPRREF